MLVGDKMKIGIITWFEYENYGTKLQAVALQCKLRRFGHEAYLLNFYPKSNKIQRPFLSKVGNRILRTVKESRMKNVYQKYYADLERKKILMQRFITDRCLLTDRINDDTEYIAICNSMDLLIFGSDQIWNPVDFHPYYYGKFDSIKTPKVSYAPSFGISKLDDSIVSEYEQALSSFAYITVRENVGVNIIRNQLGLKAIRVVDPTMLLSDREWMEYLSIEKSSDNYTICYLLGDNYNHFKEAKRFSDAHNTRLVVLHGSEISFKADGQIVASAGPKEFVQMISGAQYVITDSFHALVFSLLFEKDFFVFYRFQGDGLTNENSRITQIIEEFNIPNRLVNYDGIIPLNGEKLRYSGINKHMEDVRNESEKILYSLINDYI